MPMAKRSVLQSAEGGLNPFSYPQTSPSQTTVYSEYFEQYYHLRLVIPYGSNTPSLSNASKFEITTVRRFFLLQGVILPLH